MSAPYKFEEASVAKDVGEYIIYKKPLGISLVIIQEGENVERYFWGNLRN